MERRIVLVVGSGRSGPAAVAGTLEALGLVAPDPAWVARLHSDLLNRSDVAVDDGRPGAWLEAGKVAVEDAPRARLEGWLGPQLEQAPELVVSDPGLPWLLGLWRWAALRCGAEVAHVVVHGDGPEAGDDVERTAARVNAMLHTELGTRDETRHLVRYDDLLADWTIPVAAAGDALGIATVRAAPAQEQRRAHEHVRGLRPAERVAWDDLRLPARLRQIAAATAHALAADDRAALDELRSAYLDLYEEAESISQSSVVAVRNRRRKQP